MASQTLHQLAQLHQQTPINQHEHIFNSIAQPLLQYPQYQTELSRLYMNSLNQDLKSALHEFNYQNLHLHQVQYQIRALARKFDSIDAYAALYSLKQSGSIIQHNQQIDSLLALLEEPMADDLLQDMYRKSLNQQVQRQLRKREFKTFHDLRAAVADISR